ncbi:MAG: phosphotransferase [Pseudomonadota bacterium]|nr:MAG: phosphotransferase [Pseudomonadota bacterium]
MTGRALDRLLADALASWRRWGLPLTGPPRLKAAIPDGRTNRNLRLDAPGLDADLLLRLNHPAPRRLGIDRAREREILALTARAGISRPACYWDPDDRFVIFPYIEGRCWQTSDYDRPQQRRRLWPLIERLGEVSLDWPRRRYLDYLRHYWSELERHDATDPPLRARWHAFEPELAAFDRSVWPVRLVHHDLVPANVIDSGGRLYLIDWEYAAPGHPDIDVWAVDPGAIREPFIAEMMGWIVALWERLIRI